MDKIRTGLFDLASKRVLLRVAMETSLLAQISHFSNDMIVVSNSNFKIDSSITSMSKLSKRNLSSCVERKSRLFLSTKLERKVIE